MGLLNSQSVALEGTVPDLAQPHHLALDGIVVVSQLAIVNVGTETITDPDDGGPEVSITMKMGSPEKTITDPDDGTAERALTVRVGPRETETEEP